MIEKYKQNLKEERRPQTDLFLIKLAMYLNKQEKNPPITFPEKALQYKYPKWKRLLKFEWLKNCRKFWKSPASKIFLDFFFYTDH